MPRLLSLKRPNLFRGIHSRYRMVLINEKSLKEVASVRLTKGAVYGMLSTAFVGIALATLALLVWTPLRFYIPGYGSSANRQAVLQLRQRVDSLTDAMAAQDRQLTVVKNIIAGEDPIPQDTTTLTDAEIARAGLMPTILPQADEIQGLAQGKPIPLKPGFPVPKLKKLPPVPVDSAAATMPAKPGAPQPAAGTKPAPGAKPIPNAKPTPGAVPTPNTPAKKAAETPQPPQPAKP